MNGIKSRKQQRLDTDERIVNSAIVEFAKHGFKGAKVTDIAKGADISQGRIAQNFGSKKKLFLKIVQKAVDNLSAFLEGKDGGWRELLYEVVECVRKGINTDKGLQLMQMMGAMLGYVDTPKEASAISAKAFMQSKIPSALLDGQAKGEVKQGDIGVLYSLFYRNMSSTLTVCKLNGIQPPPNDWFVGVIENNLL